MTDDEPVAYGLWLLAIINAAFIIVMIGFLLQWPTLLTLLIFPVLVAMYVRLAHIEEAEARQAFGTAYDGYAARVPSWIPRLGRPGTRHGRPV